MPDERDPPPEDWERYQEELRHAYGHRSGPNDEPLGDSKIPSKVRSWWHSCTAAPTALSWRIEWPMAIIVAAIVLAYILHREFNMTESFGEQVQKTAVTAVSGISTMAGVAGSIWHPVVKPAPDMYPPLPEWQLKPVFPTVEYLIPGLKVLQMDLDVVNAGYHPKKSLTVNLTAFEELDKVIKQDYDKTLETFDFVRHRLHNIIEITKRQSAMSLSDSPENSRFQGIVQVIQAQWDSFDPSQVIRQYQQDRPTHTLHRRFTKTVHAIKSLHRAHQDQHQLSTEKLWTQMQSVAIDVCETASRIQKLEGDPQVNEYPSYPKIKGDAALVSSNSCHMIRLKLSVLRDTKPRLSENCNATASLLSNATQILANLASETRLQEKAIDFFEKQCKDIAKLELDSLGEFYDIPHA